MSTYDLEDLAEEMLKPEDQSAVRSLLGIGNVERAKAILQNAADIRRDRGTLKSYTESHLIDWGLE